MTDDRQPPLPDIQYADLDGPGYSRRRQGRGFSYFSADGKRLSDSGEIAWCKSLVIPPAWQQVWISPNRRAHILSTGLDAKQRKQYLYHPEWNTWRNLQKFEGLQVFPRRLQRIRARVEADLSRARFSRRRVIASAVRLIDQGLVRVGNEAYRRDNQTYGATTLRSEHVEVGKDSVDIDFTAKSGKHRHIELDDPALARSLAACQELPGQRLFQYRTRAGKVVAVTSTDVNAYLKDASGNWVTAKDFRTWGGTVAAFRHADAHREEAPRKLAVAAAKHAAAVLGNTLTVARKYYIHPALLVAIEAGETPPPAPRRWQQLDREETSVAKWLQTVGDE